MIFNKGVGKMYYDTLTGKYVDRETLKKEFSYLVATNQVATKSFLLYISDCVKSGNLEIVKNYSTI